MFDGDPSEFGQFDFPFSGVLDQFGETAIDGIIKIESKIPTGEIEETAETDDGKNKAAVELGRRGGKAWAEKVK